MTYYAVFYSAVNSENKSHSLHAVITVIPTGYIKTQPCVKEGFLLLSYDFICTHDKCQKAGQKLRKLTP